MDLNEVVTVPPEAVGVEGSSVYLKTGESLSVKDLLYGLMLRSGNDCATALAILHSESITAFVDCMNRRALALGASDTHFENPSGLPHENHFTTALDLCTIARFAMQNDTFKEVVKTVEYTGTHRSFTNKNKMLKTFEGANGVKTGYTVKAGRCLVSSAVRDGMGVLCVVLNCPDMFERSAALLENCFAKYSLLKIGRDSIFLCGGIPCKLNKEATLLVPKEDGLQFSTVDERKKHAVKIGEVGGKLRIFSKNSLLFEENLYSIVTVK
jgi:D-alanyl-D-alanine carboxypeptidase (penicillin-binding protein 5/6)